MTEDAPIDISLPNAGGDKYQELMREELVVPWQINSIHNGGEFGPRCRNLGAKREVLKGKERQIRVTAIRPSNAGGKNRSGHSFY